MFASVASPLHELARRREHGARLSVSEHSIQQVVTSSESSYSLC